MRSDDRLCLVNGNWADSVPVLDRGLAYGHGLFETLRLHRGVPPLWSYHLQRLSLGAERLAIKLDSSRLQCYLDTLLAHCPGEGVIKIILTAGVGGRGYRVADAPEPQYVLHWFPTPASLSTWSPQGLSLTLCGHRLPHNPGLAGIKHLNRLDQVLARMEWRDEFQEGLMLDQRGGVIEGTTSNLFCLRAGQWLTPSLHECGVAGVMRQYLLDSLLPGMGLSAFEAVINRDELRAMDELFVCNSVSGVWPVRSIAGIGSWPVGAGVQVIRARLQQEFPCYH
ncbi:aminodeoxychorismate lyase [Porticoccus sp.]